jgi:hypothetical protein
MELISLIGAIIAFFAMIGFFVMVSNTTDIKNATRDTHAALKAIHSILKSQAENEGRKQAQNKIVKPGEQIEL